MSLTWARRTSLTLLIGLFTLATAAATAQPRRGQPGEARVRAQPKDVAKARFQRGPRIRRGQLGNKPGTRPRADRRGPPGQVDVRRAMRPGQRGRATARKVAVPPKAKPAAELTAKAEPTAKPKAKPKAQEVSETEARRLAKLKAANRDKGVFGAVARKTKDKGSLVNQLLFYILFSLIICFSLVTITRKSPLMAALSLLVVFLALAGVYLFLQAPFMAAIQLIVYAGAIIVLFVFVIMSIGFDEERSIENLGKEIFYFALAFMLTCAGAFVFHAGSGLVYVAGFVAMELLALAFILLGKLRYPVTRFLGIAAVTFALAQVVRLVQLSPVWIGKTVGLKTHLDAPSQMYAAPSDGSFGSAKAIGQSVFTDNVFAFEALSLLLLAAVVAAVVIVRSRKENEEQTS
jgi:NADH:ubiquinone oxidoreductase subunit 6 (subunit J)